MATPNTNAVFLALVIILVVAILILLGIGWKFLRPGIMRTLMRPKSSPSGECVVLTVDAD